jgi:AcrR family transcriptional regulator
MATSTRHIIIEAATELFHEHGFHATGLDAILARAGVTKTTFYNHFESKDALVIAVLHEKDRQEMADWLAIMRARGQGDPRREVLALFELLEEWFVSAEFRGCMFLRAASEYPSPNDPVHQASMIHTQSLTREMRERAERAGACDAEGLAGQLMLLIIGATHSRTMQGAAGGPSVRAAAALLLEGAIGRVMAA